MKNFWLRRWCELQGVVGLGVVALVVVALASASFNDPSFNTATSKPAANLVGTLGAFGADFLRQWLGLGAYGLIIPPLAWSILRLQKRSVTAFRWRLACTVLSSLLLTIFLAAFSFNADGILEANASGVNAGGALWANAGGALGALFLQGLSSGILGAAGLITSDPSPFVVTVVVAGLCFSLGGITLGYASSLRMRTLANGVVWVWQLWRNRLKKSPNKTQEGTSGTARALKKKRLRTQLFKKKTKKKTKQKSSSSSSVAKRQGKPTFMPYEMPPLSYLTSPPPPRIDKGAQRVILEANIKKLEEVLDDFGIKGRILRALPGPVVTLYELEPSAGIKTSRVIGLADDIARSMSVLAARVAVIPGRNVIGIELPNSDRSTVYLGEILADKSYNQGMHQLPLILGKDISGAPVVADLATMPHLLIAGTTGSGKSVGINAMILSLLYRLAPEQCRFIMVDPKMLELSVYDGIPHLLAPVVTEPKKAVVALKWVVREMEDRYRRMAKLSVRNIESYNGQVTAALNQGKMLSCVTQTGFNSETGEPVYEREEIAPESLPFIVVVIDEMADLMMVAGKDVETAVQRLAQMARAAGIHIIMATQRPSVDVITGTIKANFPTRISFQVTSKIDSRTILGEQGGEQLLGKGDMLSMMGGGRFQRVHGPFVTDAEVAKIVQFLKRQPSPDYQDVTTLNETPADGFPLDSASPHGEGASLYEQAVEVVLHDGRASTSYVQRRLQIGYNRAANLIERMETEGVISPPNAAGKRTVLQGPAKKHPA